MSNLSTEWLRMFAIIVKEKRNKIVIVGASENIGYVCSLLSKGVLGYVLRSATDADLFSAIRAANEGRHFIDPQLSDALTRVLTNAKKREGRSAPILSEREVQVLVAVARGFTNKEIATHLGLSHKTVETYRTRIYDKLGLKKRTDLVAYAIASGLLADDAVQEAFLS